MLMDSVPDGAGGADLAGEIFPNPRFCGTPFFVGSVRGEIKQPSASQQEEYYKPATGPWYTLHPSFPELLSFARIWVAEGEQ